MFLKNKNIIFKIRRSKVTDYAALRAILGNSHAHISCFEKQENLSGSRFSDHFTISDQYSFWILVCQMDISAFI